MITTELDDDTYDALLEHADDIEGVLVSIHGLQPDTMIVVGDEAWTAEELTRDLEQYLAHIGRIGKMRKRVGTATRATGPKLV